MWRREKTEFINRIQNGIIVSCQALVGELLYTQEGAAITRLKEIAQRFIIKINEVDAHV